jgi:hypothetical protein
MTYDPSAFAIETGGAWVLIETVTVSNQASVDLDLIGTHKMFMVHIDNLVPASDDVELWLRFSTDLGDTFLAGTNYSWTLTGGRGTGSNFEDVQATSRINLTGTTFGTMGTATIENLNGFVCIHNANQTTRAVQATTEIAMVDAAGTNSGWTGGGSLLTNIDEVDAIQLIAESGNLSTGRITLYGLNLS